MMNKELFYKKYLLLLWIFVFFLVFPSCKKEEVKPNILLVTIDTLRRDHLGCYGYPLETSPFIDQLAREGLVYKNTITPLPLTDGSHASILTSLHPLTHQVIKNATALDMRIETIAEVLKKNGYYTIGAVAVYHLSRKYKFAQGFDSFSDRWDKGLDRQQNWQRFADSVNKSLFTQINEYLEKYKNKPLFIWVHYYDPHAPYIDRQDIVFADREIRERHEKEKDFINYDKEIRYTDNHIRELYGYLEAKGLTGKMVTCITADHGEQLGEHGFSAEHADFYSETTFVPLVFHGWKIPKNKITNHYVSTLDIAPTLLALVNLDFEKPVHGLNLLDTKGNRKTKRKKITGRDFLVIGNPGYVRSIQWINLPYSYILNFDFLYKQWFISRETASPGMEDRLKPVPGKAVNIENLKESNGYQISVNYPYTIRKGPRFGILKFDVKKDNGFSVGYEIGPGMRKHSYTFDKKEPGTVTAFFPVTPLDQLTGIIEKNKETEIANLKYALLPEKEFLEYLTHFPSKVEVESGIFEKLRTLRKFKTSDELFNLETDFEMVKNILETVDDPHSLREHKVKVVKGKKSIYERLRFYLKEKRKIMGKIRRSKPLTEEEKKMLKSLGYL